MEWVLLGNLVVLTASGVLWKASARPWPGEIAEYRLYYYILQIVIEVNVYHTIKSLLFRL